MNDRLDLVDDSLHIESVRSCKMTGANLIKYADDEFAVVVFNLM